MTVTYGTTQRALDAVTTKCARMTRNSSVDVYEYQTTRYKVQQELRCMKLI